jgi:hypothetical protein
MPSGNLDVEVVFKLEIQWFRLQISNLYKDVIRTINNIMSAGLPNTDHFECRILRITAAFFSLTIKFSDYSL